MNRKRILIFALIIFVGLLLSCVLFVATTGVSTSSQKAYQACRLMMLNKKGYEVWKLQNTRYQPSKAEFDFDDGFNTATCEAIRLGPFWLPSGKFIETAVGCMQSFDIDCRRAKFGVNP